MGNIISRLKNKIMKKRSKSSIEQLDKDLEKVIKEMKELNRDMEQYISRMKYLYSNMY